MDTKLDPKTLNLVLPYGNARIFHTPISSDVFEMNYRIISATKAAIFARGFGYAADAGPRIATLRLKDEGRRDAKDLGEEGDGGAQALLSEIKRLTMILKPGPDGWDTVPVSQGLDAEEWKEVEAILVFFTCFYWMAPLRQRRSIADGAASGLGGEITSHSLSEWIASYPPSTQDEASPTT